MLLIYTKVIENIDREGGKVYCPIYYFNVSNITYECKSNYESTSYPDFSKDLIYYNPLNPEDCLTQYEVDKSSFDNIFYLLGSIIIFIGGIYIIVISIDGCCNCPKYEPIPRRPSCHCYECLGLNIEDIADEDILIAHHEWLNK